jgi:predicted RNA-binding Zn-ribbon protein involved in translation (DUF1610 family)
MTKKVDMFKGISNEQMDKMVQMGNQSILDAGRVGDCPMLCPVCHNYFTDYPALSRKDNDTLICPQCGMNEAMVEYFKEEAEKAAKKIREKMEEGN